MAWFTTQVRTICEQAWLDSHPGSNRHQMPSNPNDVITSVWDKVIPQDWTIWDGGSKKELSISILKHYYIREIGLETVGLFKFYLGMRMAEIMPYYVQLFNSQLDYDDIFNTQDKTVGRGLNRKEGESIGRTKTAKMKSDDTSQTSGTSHDEGNTDTSNQSVSKQTTTTDETFDGEEVQENTENISAESSSNASHSTDGLKKYADTPQNGLQDVIDNTYLTNVTIDNASENNTSKDTSLGETTTNGTDTKHQTRNVVTDSNGNVQDTGNKSTTNDGTTSTSGQSSHTSESGENEDTTRDKETGEKENITYRGFEGNRVQFTMEYREAIINITKMIIHDLADLFIGIL